MIGLILATVLAAAPLYEHSDAQGNYVFIGQGACFEGPMSLRFEGMNKSLSAGQDWPPGCFPRDGVSRHRRGSR